MILRKEMELKTEPIVTDTDSGVYYIHINDKRAFREADKFFDRTTREFRKKLKDDSYPVTLMIDRRGNKLYAVCYGGHN